MVKINVGHRVGKDGRLAIGCSASVFDEKRQKMLLIRRVDNNLWAVPGGYMEAGESLSEACQREVQEETGLSVEIDKLLGVFTSPNLLLEYEDGNKWQLVVLHFQAEVTAGEIALSDETSEIRFFTQSESENLPMSPLERMRVQAGFAHPDHTIVCDDFLLNSA